MGDASERTLALAGLLQATAQVHDIATRGRTSPADLSATLNTLFVFSPESVLEVFGGLRGLVPGIRVAHSILYTDGPGPHLPALRYISELTNRERRISQDPEQMRVLRVELERISNVFDLPGEDYPPPILEELASLYESVVGHDGGRIRIIGSRTHLQRHENVVKIRALLLAGFRAAVLWHQLGGSRWRLLLDWSKTRASIETSREMLVSAGETVSRD